MGVWWGHRGGVYIWPNISLTHRLMKCHTDLQYYHSWSLDACTGGESGVGCQGGWQGALSIRGHWCYIWKMKMFYCNILLKTRDGLLNTADNRTWAQVNGPQVSTTLSHQMPLPGVSRGHSEVMGWGYIWQNISLNHRLTKCHTDLQWDHSWSLDACTGGGDIWGLTGDVWRPTGGICRHRGVGVLLLITRCLYWGWEWGGVSRGLAGGIGHQGALGLHLKNEDVLLQSTLENSRWSIEHCRQ